MSAQEFIELFNNSVRDRKESKIKWVDSLRKEGVRASHPNDGWIDRENKIAQFCYPHFNMGVKEGDRIALGTFEKYEIVEVYKVLKTDFLAPIIKYYYKSI